MVQNVSKLQLRHIQLPHAHFVTELYKVNQATRQISNGVRSTFRCISRLLHDFFYDPFTVYLQLCR